MHTAFEVRKSMFQASRNGEPIDPFSILDWGPQDRFGILIDRPVGALGGGLLILLAICAFYDVPGKKRRRRPLYPEIYLFHVGGRWGSFMNFDFWPQYKEVFVEGGPPAVLTAINSHGITHLAVPDRDPAPVTHLFKEPEAAADRLKRCFAYDPGGDVGDASWSLTTTDMGLLANFDAVLEVDRLAENSKRATRSVPLRLLPPPGDEMDGYAEILAGRIRDELRRDHPDHQKARMRVDRAITTGSLSESYRAISIEAALQMLGQ